MGKKIDITPTERAQLTSDGSTSDLAYLKANGPRALPNSPTSSNWSAEAIKKQLYKQPEILFAWLQKLASAQLALANEIDDYLQALAIGKTFGRAFNSTAEAQAELEAGNIESGSIVLISNGSDFSVYHCSGSGLSLVGQSFATLLARITENESDIAMLESYFTSGKAKKAIADEDGSNIKATYATNSGAVHKAETETITGKKTFTNSPLFDCDVTFDYQRNILMWDGFIRTTGDKFLEIGGDSVNKVAYKVPYYGQSFYGNTYVLATTSQVATAKSEAISSAATTAQSKVDALASAMNFSNGAFGTIVAALLKVTKMEVTDTETKTATLEDQFLEMLAGNTVAYGTNYVGFVFAKYDAINDFFVGIYNDTLMIGDCTATRNANGKITNITPISLEPLATRAASNALTDGHLLKWDGVNLRLIDAGVSDTDISSVLLQESSRVSAENARVLAEQGRVASETERALQEKYRVINHPYAITQAEYNTLMSGGVFGVHLSTPLIEGDEPELIYTVYASQAAAEAANETYVFPIQENIQYPPKGIGGDAPYLSFPAFPVADGTYIPKLTVSNGVATIEWEAVE